MYLQHEQDKDFIHIYDFSDAAKIKHLHWLVLSYFFSNTIFTSTGVLSNI